MYYTVIEHDKHLRTPGKCIKHGPQVSVFYISQVFSNVVFYHSVIHSLDVFIWFMILG